MKTRSFLFSLMLTLDGVGASQAASVDPDVFAQPQSFNVGLPSGAHIMDQQ